MPIGLDLVFKWNDKCIERVDGSVRRLGRTTFIFNSVSDIKNYDYLQIRMGGADANYE